MFYESRMQLRLFVLTKQFLAVGQNFCKTKIGNFHIKTIV